MRDMTYRDRHYDVSSSSEIPIASRYEDGLKRIYEFINGVLVAMVRRMKHLRRSGFSDPQEFCE
jgi:hypothetical protein